MGKIHIHLKEIPLDALSPEEKRIVENLERKDTEMKMHVEMLASTKKGLCEGWKLAKDFIKNVRQDGLLNLFFTVKAVKAGTMLDPDAPILRSNCRYAVGNETVDSADFMDTREACRFIDKWKKVADKKNIAFTVLAYTVKVDSDNDFGLSSEAQVEWA